MAAGFTVPQLSSLTPRHGVVTLIGYGIQVRVERGHLVVADGIGALRHARRYARVGHGLQRLVIIGADGMVSLAALRWLADQGAAFVMLDRDGTVLLSTGPVSPSDARLRRAQALADVSGVGIEIARDLIARKLTGQARVAHDALHDAAVADAITSLRPRLTDAANMDAIRLCESFAARAYWSAWRAASIQFPTRDLPRVPVHWRTCESRTSPLTQSPRRAATPVNAMLNYLYTVLETEARLAAAALGLDPGLGVMHMDSRSRDSLAADLMEPVRPEVDAFVLEWIAREPLRRAWFFEQRDGSCRLMASLAARLSETAPLWRRAVAPHAERVARALASSLRPRGRATVPPTRLTQTSRRQAHGGSALAAAGPTPRPPCVCRGCGKAIRPGCRHCKTCLGGLRADRIVTAARVGRVAAQSKSAQAKRARTQAVQMAGRLAWRAQDQPAWLTAEVYVQQIQPRLPEIAIARIASALQVSEPYASNIRSGRRQPHPRHWRALAQLVGTPKTEAL